MRSETIDRTMQKSSLTDSVIEYLYDTVRCRIMIEHTEVGVIRLNQSMAKEFAHALRAHRCRETIPWWIKRLRADFIINENRDRVPAINDEMDRGNGVGQ